VYFLYRSMNRHLRKVPSRFDQQQRQAPDVQPSAGSSSAEPEPERPEQDS
jgi:hypothetical protein